MLKKISAIFFPLVIFSFIGCVSTEIGEADYVVSTEKRGDDTGKTDVTIFQTHRALKSADGNALYFGALTYVWKGSRYIHLSAYFEGDAGLFPGMKGTQPANNIVLKSGDGLNLTLSAIPGSNSSGKNDDGSFFEYNEYLVSPDQYTSIINASKVVNVVMHGSSIVTRLHTLEKVHQDLMKRFYNEYLSK